MASQHFLKYVNNLDKFVSITEAVLLIPLGAIGLLLQLGWTIHVGMNIKRSYNSRRRIRDRDECDLYSQSQTKDCNNKITQGKLLLTLLVLEFVVCICYWLGYSFPQIAHVYPSLKKISIPYNLTCISEVNQEREWIYELQYPPTLLFLSLARSNTILTFGVALSLFKFLSNTFVTKIWKYSKIYRPIKYTVVLSTIIFILGLIPQINLLSRLITLIAFIVLLRQIWRHAVFFSKAMEWRKQDLYHNNELYLLQQHQKYSKYFYFTIRWLSIAILVIFLTELVQFVEIVFGLSLYYGQCIFPHLYGVRYTSVLTQEQIPILRIFMVLFGIIEKLLTISGTVLYAWPYMYVTLVLVIRNRIEKRQVVYRYSLVESLVVRQEKA
eukprot:TRINITY_DN25163_c0_g1_i1.p1 TRINITY_DN25163_c0_g1~~TRINITY_DN25163_c0_g1_i1.p1  ORF type:complete len:382 (-),score=40.45 TRINITY_DN25163_c0_g1_i1:113-1258(-)